MYWCYFLEYVRMFKTVIVLSELKVSCGEGGNKMQGTSYYKDTQNTIGAQRGQ